MEEKIETTAKVARGPAGTPKAARYHTLAEVAAAYGYTRSAAQAWSRRDDFPDPRVIVGNTPGWSLEDVNQWAARYRPDILPSGPSA